MFGMETWPIVKIEQLLNSRNIRLQEIVLMAEVGSTVHGINVGGQDDLDLTVIRIEQWVEFVNAFSHNKEQSMMIRTKPDGERSMPDDLDINVYTVRKFASLMASGNPSVLTAFFSPKRDASGHWRDRSDMLLEATSSQMAGKAFRGYMQQQLERWVGKRGQKNVNRPELVEAYGFDTKYAGHIIRLGLQGVEFMETGRLTLPMNIEDAALIRGVRTGKYTQAEALEIARDVEFALEAAIETTTLRVNPDRQRIEAWVSEFYASWYT